LKIINSIIKKPLKTPTVVTIGTFDGVHIGHRKIIQQLVATAKQKNLASCVLTFFPHPRMVLQKDADIKLINTIDERSKLLEDLGLDYLFIKNFTKGFSRWTAEDFVEKLLVKSLNAKTVIIGYDHRFGRNRSASVEDLKEFGTRFGFEVMEISQQDVNQVTVSSTKIRNALNAGDIETANSYLGYNYMLNGTVIKGRQIGKTIGFPTANIGIEEFYKLIPKKGAYIVRATIEENPVFGMMNIGVNPTVNGENQSIEVHFFNFDKTLYHFDLKVELLYRLRDELHFDSIESLKAQLQKDKTFSLQYINTHYA